MTTKISKAASPYSGWGEHFAPNVSIRVIMMVQSDDLLFIVIQIELILTLSRIKCLRKGGSRQCEKLYTVPYMMIIIDGNIQGIE